jgi:hypothetical protein
MQANGNDHMYEHDPLDWLDQQGVNVCNKLNLTWGLMHQYGETYVYEFALTTAPIAKNHEFSTIHEMLRTDALSASVKTNLSLTSPLDTHTSVSLQNCRLIKGKLGLSLLTEDGKIAVDLPLDPLNTLTLRMAYK